jgi:hypothetical protein
MGTNNISHRYYSVIVPASGSGVPWAVGSVMAAAGLRAKFKLSEKQNSNSSTACLLPIFDCFWYNQVPIWRQEFVRAFLLFLAQQEGFRICAQV